MKTKTCILLCLVLVIPILLNVFLRIQSIPVIQSDTTPALWLSFWGNYGGSLISAFIAFYILYINRKDQYATLYYELEIKSIEEHLPYAVNYISIYNINDIKQVYYTWKSQGDKNLCKDRIKTLYDRGFYHYEFFMIKYERDRLSKEDFFLDQQKHYKKYMDLLSDLQILVSLDKSLWKSSSIVLQKCTANSLDISRTFKSVLEKCRDGEPLFERLLKDYNIDQVSIEKEVHIFFDEERSRVKKDFEKSKR